MITNKPTEMPLQNFEDAFLAPRPVLKTKDGRVCQCNALFKILGGFEKITASTGKVKPGKRFLYCEGSSPDLFWLLTIDKNDKIRWGAAFVATKIVQELIKCSENGIFKYSKSTYRKWTMTEADVYRGKDVLDEWIEDTLVQLTE